MDDYPEDITKVASWEGHEAYTVRSVEAYKYNMQHI